MHGYCYYFTLKCYLFLSSYFCMKCYLNNCFQILWLMLSYFCPEKDTAKYICKYTLPFKGLGSLSMSLFLKEKHIFFNKDNIQLICNTDIGNVINDYTI